jgi:arylsulfatase A-like enzyme
LPSLALAERPNILWIVSEDNSISWVGCYGGENVQTPNIDKLAKEGFRYNYCFDNAAVCAPTRSTWITGHYAISLGTQPMRSRYAIPHDKVPYYPDVLREAGYHITNGGKTDYNIGSRDDKEVWLTDGKRPELKPGQNFFRIINIGDSHESNAFPKKRVQGGPLHDPAKMKLHPYHPDLPDMRLTYATYADGVARMDAKVGEALAQLEADGLADDTIVIYNSDHGGVLPRSKRFLYSSGTHCPLIVRIPEKWKHWWPADKPGMTVDRMVAFVDMPKTWLSLAGAKIPKGYQGTIFLGDGIEPEPKYNLSFRERADECADTVRSMRDTRYLYIKNYMPWFPNGQRLKYMWTMEGTQAWEKHFIEGKTDAVTGRFFQERPSGEFYDTEKDFHNIKNLINDPKHKKKISELKTALRKKQIELYDSGLIPEGMRVRRAKANNMTIYEMVRDPKLYPLEKYMDLADAALSRNPKYVNQFAEQLNDADPGVQYWGAAGLFLLGKQASDKALQMESVASSDAEAEVRTLLAWALERLGEKAKAEAIFAAFPKFDDAKFLETVNKMRAPREISVSEPTVPLSNTEWEIIGPFMGEGAKDPDVFTQAEDPNAKWQTLSKGFTNKHIDLQAQLGEHDDCSAFVRTVIESDKNRSAKISAWCDDIVAIRLNGKTIPDSGKKVTKNVALKKGNNELILKLIDHKRGWKFNCHIE